MKSEINSFSGDVVILLCKILAKQPISVVILPLKYDYAHTHSYCKLSVEFEILLPHLCRLILTANFDGMWTHHGNKSIVCTLGSF